MQRRKKRGPGRPSKLTPDVKERILNTVRCGGSFRMAAQSAGIGESTFGDWKRKGEDPDAPREYRLFFQELQKAEAEGNAARVAIVMKAARNDWKAASWLLERRLPELFSIRYQLEINGLQPNLNLLASSVHIQSGPAPDAMPEVVDVPELDDIDYGAPPLPAPRDDDG